MLVHLDTDFAGNTDDACALAMLLGWPDVEISGITTTADPDGRRAAYVERFLELAGRTHIAVEAGAGASLTTGLPMGDLPDHATYWGGGPVTARPAAVDAAVGLMAGSVERGATVVAIGPYTNLGLLEDAHRGALSQVPVVVMGGWVSPPADGMPSWGPERDWNVQCDTRAAVTVLRASADLTLATLPGTLGAHLRERDVERLAASGSIGRLLARQGRAHAAEHDVAQLGRSHAALPDDLLNFHFDPAACAVALGWPGADVQTMALEPVLEGEVLRFAPSDEGRAVRVVVGLDGPAFADLWLTAVEVADRRA